MLLILVLCASTIASIVPVHAQPTKNLEAKYYNNHNRYTAAGATFSGTVILTELITNIDQTQKNPAGRSNYWSVLIEGFIYAPEDGNYGFETYSDDGVRVFVDGTRVINNWTNHGTTRNLGFKTLTAGWKPIRIAMYEWGGFARLRFKWKLPSESSYTFPPADNLSTMLPDTTPPHSVM